MRLYFWKFNRDIKKLYAQLYALILIEDKVHCKYRDTANIVLKRKEIL